MEITLPETKIEPLKIGLLPQKDLHLPSIDFEGASPQFQERYANSCLPFPVTHNTGRAYNFAVAVAEKKNSYFPLNPGWFIGIPINNGL